MAPGPAAAVAVAVVVGAGTRGVSSRAAASCALGKSAGWLPVVGAMD